jgi:hypothetical protein
MATVSAARSSTSVPVFAPAGGGAVGFAWGVYEIASALSKDDIIEFCRIPPCHVIDGFLRADDIDTGTEALELDVGYSGAATAFLDSGVLTGDVIAGHVSVASINAHFTGLKDGPIAITSETLVIGTVTAAANAGGTGTVYCGVYYVVD